MPPTATATPARTCDARLLLRQIGTDARLAVSARDLVDLGNGVMFRYGSNHGDTRKLLITLAADDTYTVRAVRISRRTLETIEIGTVDGVHAAELAACVRAVNIAGE